MLSKAFEKFNWCRFSYLYFVSVSALAANPTYNEVHQLLENKKWNDALAPLQQLYSDSPNSVLLGQDLAQTLVRLNQRQEALLILKKFKFHQQIVVYSTAFISEEGYKLFQEGLHWLDRDNYSNSIEKLSAGLSLDKLNIQIMFRLLQSKTLDGDLNGASEMLAEIKTSYYEYFPEALSLWKGILAFKTGDILTAIKSLDISELKTPSHEGQIWYFALSCLKGNSSRSCATKFENLHKKFAANASIKFWDFTFKALNAPSPARWLDAEKLQSLFTQAIATPWGNGDGLFRIDLRSQPEIQDIPKLWTALKSEK